MEIVSSSYFHKYIELPEVNSSIEMQKISGITYHWVRTRPYRARGIGQVYNQLEFAGKCMAHSSYFAARKPDVVVASSPHPLVVVPALMAARKARSRFIFEVRDLWPEILIELGGYSRFHPYIVLLRLAEWMGVKNADTVVSVKPGDGEYFAQKYGLPEKKFAYVPNGFLRGDEAISAPNRLVELRKQYSFLVGYVGGVSAYYRLADLVNLAESFRGRADVGFVLIGKGDRLAAIQEDATNRGLKNLHFLGSIPKTSVAASLEMLDACYVGLEDLSLHRYGISCNKIYEYMAAGKPIIGSYRAGYDPVKLGKCGIVSSPGDTASLANALDRIIREPDLAAQYSRCAREYFVAHHDFTTVSHGAAKVLCPGHTLNGPSSE